MNDQINPEDRIAIIKAVKKVDLENTGFTNFRIHIELLDKYVREGRFPEINEVGTSN